MSVQSVAQTITLWTAELETIIPIIDTTVGVNASLTNQITTALDDLKQGAAALADAEGASAQQPILQRIQADWQNVSALLLSLNLPRTVQMVVTIASTIIPVAIGLVSIFLPAQPAPPPAAA